MSQTQARDTRLDILRIRPEDMPDLSATSHTFWYDDPWVSNDLLVMLGFDLQPAERGLEPGTDADSGAPYWTFSPDYADRMQALMKVLRAKAVSGG